MPHERLRPTFIFDQERLEQLKQVVPEAFADGKINWETLREVLGEHLEEEGAEVEHFGLFWPGKREARKLASIPSKGTLVPVKGAGIDEEKTRNIFIEGENLEVLKLLQKSYAGQIKMIYIDPPYNTGNDFVYDDNFTEPLEEYLKYTGQMDEEGRLLTTNKKADGRFHSKWLSMMYPRLRLARSLLSEDGVIFISIDDNEAVHLKKICDEVFGEENFIGEIVIQSNPRGSQASTHFATVHEYLLCYGKSVEDFFLKGFEKTEESKEEYSLTTPDGKKYRLLGLRQRGGAWRKEQRPKLHFPIFANEETGEVSLTKDNKFSICVIPKRPLGELSRWTWSKEKIEHNKNLLVGKKIKRKDEPEAWDIFRIDFLKDEEGEVKAVKPKTIWDEKELNYQNGGNEIKELFGSSEVFEHPKPTFLVKKIMEMLDLDGDIIMDFFAGSGTLAHAMFDFNLTRFNNQFICIQLPELINADKEAYKKGFETISQLAIERIRRAIKKLKKMKTKENIDLGFRVFKLYMSNFKQWQSYEGKDIKELESLFKEHESPLVDSWKPENLLVEIILQEGFPLDSKVEELKEYKKNSISQVSSEFCEHKLLICLDKKVYQEIINDLQLSGNDIFVCLDSALTDEQRVRLSDKGFLKTI